MPEARPVPVEGASPIIDIEMKVLERVLVSAQRLLPPEDFEVINGLVATLLRITKLVRERGSTIARLRRLFGLKGSEKTSEVLALDPPEMTAPPPPAVGPQAQESQSPGAAATLTDDTGNGAEPPEAAAEPTAKKKRKGHGRVPSADYLAAKHIVVPHEALKPGGPCLRCQRGNLYNLKHPAPFLRIVGQAPLAATCWDCERLRCATCGAVYTARAPDEAQGGKYDETAVSIVALLRYGGGMPFHRLESLQRNLDTPLPASTQWDLVNEAAALVEPAAEELKRLAAQGHVLHNDDSYMRILELMGKRRAKLLASGKLPDPERTGLFTTAIVSIVAGIGTIALFFTGRKHAGENLAAVLDNRDKELPPPIQMGDALTRNLPKGHVVIDSNCISHGRRKLVDEVDNYPAECRFLLERLALVFKLDEECRTRGASDAERLLAHQQQSAPLMDEVRARMTAELEEHRIEPNCDMGRAFNYFLKRWEKFTLFLRKPGAPLDNNICERALKMAIRNRKNSLFYRSARGAHVGDVFMTLIHTAELHHQNPFDYLTALQRNSKAVAQKPAGWMPWNYKQTLAELAAEAQKPPASPAVAA